MVHSLVGKPAPAISLPDASGETFTFTPGEKGVPTALFFYPKSGSYGCTKEACQFRDALADMEVFKRSKLDIIGVSTDPVAKQKAFVDNQKLTYPVLSDSNGEAKKAYSVGRGMFGLTGTARVTFIVDAKGVVRDSLDATINYGSHVKFVAKWLDKLEAEDKKAAEGAAPEIPPVTATEATGNAEPAAAA